MIHIEKICVMLSTKLFLSGAPDNPSKPTIKSSQVQARSVTISWIAAPFNGYGPLRNFTVQYKNGQSWMTVKEPIPPSVTTYPVQG